MLLISLLAVILTTFGLIYVNQIVHTQEPQIYVRPYTGLYILTVLLMTWLGGRGIGFITFALCFLACLYFLLPPTGWQVSHPSDWMGLFLLSLNAAVVIYGYDALRQKATLLNATIETRQDNLRLAQETIDVRGRLQSVVEAAQEQRQGTALPYLLLPEMPEHIPGLDLRVHYEALLESDSSRIPFFDAFPVENGRTALIVGSVANAGRSTVAMIAMTRSLLRSAIYRCPTPAEAVTELNSMLVTHGLGTEPCRLFVALYQASSSTMTSVSCGELPALARRAATGQVEMLAEAGPLLGAAHDTVYRQSALRLQPGDLLLLSPGGGILATSEKEITGWKYAIASETGHPDVQQWVSRLVHFGRENHLYGGDGSCCLLAARIMESDPNGHAGTFHGV